jgi:alanyl-tRNA synthetase
MKAKDIRRKFLEFYERRGHKIVKSSPLMPANDPTLLFTNAGMNQFKDVFLGLEKRDYKRATSSQKCIRAGGKHNDLDQVGRTARHHTFFEMLGNFSFGDYFKKETVEFAWELLTEELGLEPARLWVTIFEGDAEVPADEEAAKEWERVGVPPERILRFGRKDNFWQMGETGPCGPCTEVHYYLGANPEDGNANRAEFVNGPGDTTIEIWNLVFMQYNRIGEGEISDGAYESYRLESLPSPSVDTGGGLERFAIALQGVYSIYETDLIKPIVEFIAELTGKEYGSDPATDFSMRVIADHARATAFAVTDGIAPGSAGRNYVLRKIMRRAIYHGVKGLQLESPFLHKVTEFVTELMAEPYPELVGARPQIEQTVRNEEQRFGHILTIGEPKLEEMFKRYEPALPPMSEFVRVYDTYGIPRDLIRVVLDRHGVESEEDVFNEQFDAALAEIQRNSAQLVSASASAQRSNEIYSRVTATIPGTVFTGYEETETAGARVLAIVVGEQTRQALTTGETGEVILDRTPFYAESGGQIGDTGVFEGDDFVASVEGTYSPLTGYYVHKVSVEQGVINVGDALRARVDADRRRRIKANHTGTHLLHAALREVLGPHVKQAGSLVAPDRLRFDFTHYEPLTDDEIAQIEQLVNGVVLKNQELSVEVKPLDEAIKSGAAALFGEKYASQVRVVSIAGFSAELCGGTHVHATGDIGPLKIISDSSVAAGVRRIEAITADAAFARFQTDEHLIRDLTKRLKVAPQELPTLIDRLQEQVRKQERELSQLKVKLAQNVATDATGQAREVAGLRVLVQRVSGLDVNGLRQLADSLSQQIRSGVIVLGQANNGKSSLIARVTDDLTERLNAGQIIREVSSVIGGKGGGRADMATGGGPESEKLDEALNASYEIVENMLRAEG